MSDDGAVKDAWAEVGDAFKEIGRRFKDSYHQVAEPLYQRSKYRWLNYQSQLQPHLPALQYHIERMGY